MTETNVLARWNHSTVFPVVDVLEATGVDDETKMSAQSGVFSGLYCPLIRGPS